MPWRRRGPPRDFSGGAGNIPHPPRLAHRCPKTRLKPPAAQNAYAFWAAVGFKPGFVASVGEPWRAGKSSRRGGGQEMGSVFRGYGIPPENRTHFLPPRRQLDFHAPQKKSLGGPPSSLNRGKGRWFSPWAALGFSGNSWAAHGAAMACQTSSLTCHGAAVGRPGISRKSQGGPWREPPAIPPV